MTHIKFEGDADNVVSGSYSTGTGPVLRSSNMEVTCNGETYRVKPGEATFNPSNAPHGVMAIEDVVALSFKNQVAPIYEPTGRLDG
jgi:hypothetical protein